MNFLIAKNNYYDKFGGIFVPEILMPALQQLIADWKYYRRSAAFKAQFKKSLSEFAGRPTPLTEIPRFAEAVKGPRIFLKREDLLHTGAHKINNALGQCLLAKLSGKKRVIAETGAGQHGVATAAACAHLGLPCEVYMGAVDMQRQALNVQRMTLFGAKVISVNNGTQTLKDAVNEALRDWSASFEETYYCLGSALGPHPYPEMVASFQAVIGKETKAQCLKQLGGLPHQVVACIGGGSNAIGIFSAFIDQPSVELIGVEAGGKGNKPGEHAARFFADDVGVLHGCYTYLLQNADGQIMPTHSISAGLDYPAIGPQHAALFAAKRATYVAANDQEALAALKLLAETEGILCALESAHAVAHVMKIAHELPKENIVIINLSGRGDKDLGTIIEKS
ncbi:MAG: trpBF [Gammaproteobacteria bacterium]|jgi:tryptophan synthase beta subunit|nr:trpBF [Gammaproteobacteria bacterium]